MIIKWFQNITHRIFRWFEKLFYPNSERCDDESEKQRKRRIKRRISEIEHDRTPGFIYGDRDELEQIARHFVNAGQSVERYYTTAIRINWK